MPQHTHASRSKRLNGFSLVWHCFDKFAFCEKEKTKENDKTTAAQPTTKTTEPHVANDDTTFCRSTWENHCRCNRSTGRRFLQFENWFSRHDNLCVVIVLLLFRLKGAHELCQVTNVYTALAIRCVQPLEALDFCWRCNRIRNGPSAFEKPFFSYTYFVAVVVVVAIVSIGDPKATAVRRITFLFFFSLHVCDWLAPTVDRSISFACSPSSILCTSVDPLPFCLTFAANQCIRLAFTRIRVCVRVCVWPHRIPTV